MAKASCLFSRIGLSEVVTSEDDRLWSSLMRWAYEKDVDSDCDRKATDDPMTDFIVKLLGGDEEADDLRLTGLTESGGEVFRDGSIMDDHVEPAIWEEESLF